jgi:hypothetical protein
VPTSKSVLKQHMNDDDADDDVDFVTEKEA